MHGICNLSIIPCRKSPSDRSEMVTQLLFGETFEIIEDGEKWIRVKHSYDDYVSWIDKKQYQPISEKSFSALRKETHVISFDLVHPILNTNNDSLLPIVLGSSLHGFKNHEVEFDKVKYKYDGQIIKPHVSKKTRETIIEYSFLYLNTPYLWGGRSPFGIDCSGFTQLVFKLNGVPIPRDASQQAKEGNDIDFIEEAQPGDLAFFDNDAGKIIHVGIVMGNNKIIHASGKVRIDKLDHYGIYNEEKKAYSHQLRIIKSML